MKMEKIQFVTGMHGNERLPIIALASFGVDQLVLNVEAVIRGVRCVEKDLNASFGSDGKTYEEKRAREILSMINKKKLIVDLHTFSCKSDSFIIIVDLKMLNFASCLGFKKIVYIKYNFKDGHALINHRSGVSIELGEHNDPKVLRRVKSLLDFLEGKKVYRKIELYELYGIIDKKGKYKNFRKCKDGFIPVLSGEKAYNHYGLKARKMNLKKVYQYIQKDV